MTERGDCLGCGRSIPMTTVTQTAKGLICPMCQTQDTDPIEDFKRATATAKRLGVKPDAKVSKPIWSHVGKVGKGGAE